jgi:peptide deformylase
VVVEALDLEGQPLTIEASELFARALQHEIDHLHGILFLDRVSALKRRMLLKKWKKLEAEES